MGFRRVRNGSKYRWAAVMLDRNHPIERGEVVRVTPQYGCPPTNTMGHAYVTTNAGDVYLVCTNSLVPEKEWAKFEKELQEN